LFLFSRGAVVCNIEPVTIPANFVFLCILAAIKKWLESLIVITIGFHKIYDIETISLTLSRVLHFKKVPLCITVSPIVVF